MSPPERLRRELERRRARGDKFSWAWTAAVSAALRDERVEQQVFWRQVFTEQRPLWQISYSRVPWPAKKRHTLATFDNDRSEPAHRSEPSPRGAAVLA